MCNHRFAQTILQLNMPPDRQDPFGNNAETHREEKVKSDEKSSACDNGCDERARGKRGEGGWNCYVHLLLLYRFSHATADAQQIRT